MRFPKAQAGVSKLYTAQILLIISVICGLLALFIPLFAIPAGVLAIIAFIMMMVGLGQAKKDDVNFKIAFYCAIAGIVFSVIATILTVPSPVAANIVSFLSNISTVVVQLFVITGIASVAEQLGDTGLVEKARRLLWIIIATYGIGIIIRFISALLGATMAAGIVAIVLGIIALIFEIVALVLYISLLSKAKYSFTQ